MTEEKTIDFFQDEVDGGNHTVYRGFYQIGNGPEDVAENIHDVLPCGAPVAGEHILDKLDDPAEDRLDVVDGSGNAGGPAGENGPQEWHLFLEEGTDCVDGAFQGFQRCACYIPDAAPCC